MSDRKQFTVGELIDQLQKLDNNLLVYIGHPRWEEIANDIAVGKDKIYIAEVWDE